MEIDKELLQAGVEVISDFPNKLPQSIQRSIAERMLKKDKLGDDHWCKTIISNDSDSG